MNWRIKASLQKILALSRLGDKLNHIPATLKKNHHNDVVKYQFHECLRKFSYSKLDLNNESIALEIGTGYPILSPFILHLLGFSKIVTVDIDSDIKFESFKKQIAFLNSEEYINEITKKSLPSANFQHMTMANPSSIQFKQRASVWNQNRSLWSNSVPNGAMDVEFMKSQM